MKFINQDESVKVRIGFENCYWKTVYTGDVIDLPKEYGKALGLTELKTTEGQIGNKVVETKQIDVPKKFLQIDFLKELEYIKGIGKKTAKDISKVYKNKEKLIEAINHDDELPFRDDIEVKLRKKYGRSNN